MTDLLIANPTMRTKTLLRLIIISVLSFSSIAQIKYIDKVERCDVTLNSESDESNPLFDSFSNTLYFARTFDKKNKGGFNDQDIYTAINSSGKFAERVALKSLNSKLKNAVVGISEDGNRLYLLNGYDSKNELSSSISVVEKKGSKWGAPKKMEIPDLKNLGEKISFYVSSDEKVLLLSVKDKNSFGEEDIYVSTKSTAGWTSPVNLGKSINTSKSEISPFLSKNQDTLYFASDGHPGEGSYDVFYSVRKGTWTNWTKPVHLGGEINTKKSDSYFSYFENTAFWSSDFESEAGDIFTGQFAEIPKLIATCQGTDASVNGAEDGTIFLDIQGGLSPFTYKWSNGSSEMNLMNIGKGFYSVEITDALGQIATLSCKIDEPAPVVFDEVENLGFKNQEFIHYFNYNENKLTVSKGELKKFIKEVDKQFKEGRSKVTINIYSSASQVPTTTYDSNETLTKLRAENMKYDLSNYFNQKTSYGSKVNVVIVKSDVDGPTYIEDFHDRKKYRPYQFVGLKTE